MAFLKVHAVYIITRGTIHNAAHLRPKARHGAHAAALQRAIDGAAAQIECSKLLSYLTQGDDFRVRGGVTRPFRLIVSFGDHFSVAHNNASHFPRPWCLISNSRLFYSEPHELFI